MTRYVIIEDEPSAVRRLQRKLKTLRPSWVCAGTADSIVTGQRLLEFERYDVVFSDIELSDGNSFEIFRRLDSDVSIIFITAFSGYAIKAFDFNSIHYLLKPIKDEMINAAIEKFESNPNHFKNDSTMFSSPPTMLSQKLISRMGQKSTFVDTKDIAFFHHKERITRAYTKDKSRHLIDQSMEALIGYLSNDNFFRINRQTIVNKDYIEGYSRISSNRLLLNTAIGFGIDLIVSKENTSPFKEWIS